MQIGKLDSKLLEKIVFQNIRYKRPEVLVRAGIGEDCAVVDYGDEVCVLSIDPITAAIEEIGRIAVHVSCNDIASNGIDPLGIMLAVMLPPSVTEEQIEMIMKQAGEEAEKLQVEIIGGHTEITNAVTQPVIVSTALGRCKKDEYVDGRNVKPGDVLIMTKTAGLEGMGIFACDYSHLLADVLSDEEIQKAKELLGQISVTAEGLIAGRCKASAMHDVTEGGILGAVWEMCEASGFGADIYAEQIPLEEVTKKACKAFDIDPFRLISSGSLLIAIDQEKEGELFSRMESAGIQAARIGVMTKQNRRLISENGSSQELLPPQSDQLYRIHTLGHI